MKNMTNEQKKERTIADAQGREIPVKVVDKDTLKRDVVVKKVMDRAIKRNERIISDKRKIKGVYTDTSSDSFEHCFQIFRQFHGIHKLIVSDGSISLAKARNIVFFRSLLSIMQVSQNEESDKRTVQNQTGQRES